MPNNFPETSLSRSAALELYCIDGYEFYSQLFKNIRPDVYLEAVFHKHCRYIFGLFIWRFRKKTGLAVNIFLGPTCHDNRRTAISGNDGTCKCFCPLQSI